MDTNRIAVQGDLARLYPHVRNEILTLGVLLNIMEGLVRRDRHLRLQPGLATLWEVLTPLHWQFHLRRGVTQREHRAGEVMRFARNDTLGGRA